ncbi:protein MIZU-KUSSEI 1 [Malania oleifera]|uniref:protein MIZU-KUSSEI 1 n=1 Tax=Malania oleifera TaxID=397392 RepID=UPI0025AE1823|nr:protein MIZU-KUSSEI 1 [Malania oleifera]
MISELDIRPSPRPESKIAAAGDDLSTTRPDVDLQPSRKRTPSRSAKLFRRVRSVFRSFPIIAPTSCKLPMPLHGGMGRPHGDGQVHGGTRMTGTLFGYKKARVSLAIQKSSCRLPILLLELAIPTSMLLAEMRDGMVRIALECEKQAASEKTMVVEEPVWTMYCRGKKMGYAVRREATEEDLGVMKILKAVSVGVGVLPAREAAEGEYGQLTYMRAWCERVVGSEDSETYYMMNPEGNSGPELSIFFLRTKKNY